MSQPTADERTYSIFLHLGGLAPYITFLAAPFGFLVPLVMWQVKKSDSAFIDANGREAMNFQLTLTILFVAGILFAILTFGLGLLLIIPLFFVLAILNVIFCILAAIEANKGRAYRYPFAFRLIPSPLYAPGAGGVSAVCGRCGYDLSGAPGDECPECGAPRS